MRSLTRAGVQRRWEHPVPPASPASVPRAARWGPAVALFGSRGRREGGRARTNRRIALKGLSSVEESFQRQGCVALMLTLGKKIHHACFGF